MNKNPASRYIRYWRDALQDYKLSISTKLKIDGSAVSASMNSALEALEPNSSSWRGVSAIDIVGGIGSGRAMILGSGREWDKDILAASSGKSC